MHWAALDFKREDVLVTRSIYLAHATIILIWVDKQAMPTDHLNSVVEEPLVVPLL